jgi:peroxiredoxin
VPFVVSRTRVFVIALCFSIGGGWYLSNQTSNTDTLTLVSASDPEYPTLNTNELVEGRSLPNSTLTDDMGVAVNLLALTGKPMVLNFWYSTCEPCRRELPAFAAAHIQQPEIQFIGVNMNDSVEIALAFAEKYGVTFPTLFDPSGEFISQLGIATAPTTLFVDATGNIVDQVSGEISAEKLQQLLTQWFAA